MCAAITRWVQMDPTSQGEVGEGRNAGCRGTRGYIVATASVGDSFTIGSTTNRLYMSIDGDSGPYITLYSGTSLDPRFVARDITEKMRNLGKSDERWDNAHCEWTNNYDTSGGTTTYDNCFKIYSGSLGSSSSVTVLTSGTNSVHAVLGFGTQVTEGGSVNYQEGVYGFAGTATVSGTGAGDVYYGFMDEVYKVVVTIDNGAVRGIGAPDKHISNTYNGTISTGGVFNASSDIKYSIAIDITSGSTMGGGTGSVPTMSWTSTSNLDNSSASVELLYPNTWYLVGSMGLMVKFTDAVFNTVTPEAWGIQCYKPDFAQGSNATAPVGLAQYVWSSNREDDMSSAPVTTVSGSYTRLGSKGLQIKFNPTGGADYLKAGDEFTVICAGPKPSGYNITSLNYGNVTVSTESDVKCVMFEVESGAVEVSTVKFGLQSHGTFSHHDAGTSDTMFRFGTAGPDNPAGTGDTNRIEWYPNVVAADIDSDTPPTYLYATQEDLAEVATADLSETVGNIGLVSDPIWVNIKLGAAETGANSTINSRLYFDYS